jgi:hypothetical protein
LAIQDKIQNSVDNKLNARYVIKQREGQANGFIFEFVVET